jgi:hypothetical protein
VGVDFECKPTGCNSKSCGERKPMLLSKKQVELLLAAIQGDGRACISCAPTITMESGQTARVNIQNQVHFTTGLKVVAVKGQQIFQPETTAHSTGLSASLTGSISPDRKTVCLRMHGEHTYLPGADVPKLPVTCMVTPKFVDGGVGQAMPLTQFIQAPELKTLVIDANLCVPNGETILVYGGKVERMCKFEHKVPVLSKIPYLNRLFHKVTTEPTTEHMLVLATPTIIPAPVQVPGTPPVMASTGDCPRQIATPCELARPFPPQALVPLMSATKSAVEQRAAKMAEKLVKKYHDACASGETEKARKYARQALDLDPECFAKPQVSIRVAPNPVLPSPCADAHHSITPTWTQPAPLPTIPAVPHMTRQIQLFQAPLPPAPPMPMPQR